MSVHDIRPSVRVSVQSVRPYVRPSVRVHGEVRPVPLIELSAAMYEVASREADASGLDVTTWIESAIAARSRGELPFDDMGFPAYTPDEA